VVKLEFRDLHPSRPTITVTETESDELRPLSELSNSIEPKTCGRQTLCIFQAAVSCAVSAEGCLGFWRRTRARDVGTSVASLLSEVNRNIGQYLETGMPNVLTG